jgi:NarL family two-component system response regulator LiaR
MGPPITLLIVDDHQLVRWGVRTFLSTQPDIEVVGEAASGEEALLLVGELVPDVALVDLVMPGMEGIEVTRRIKAISPRTQVIVLTSYHEDEHIFPAIRAGALSYLLKDIGTEELAQAVRKAAAGEVTMHSHVAARLVRELQSRQPASSPTLTSSLTDREVEVLSLVAEGLSNTEIAARLIISENTVKSHVSNILSKLQLTDRTQAAIYAWRKGLVGPD